MKTLFFSILLFGLSGAFSLGQATGRPVHLRPAADSPMIGNLSEGEFLIAPAEPVELSKKQKENGWEAISFLEDFRGFVERSDLSKDLEVNPGAKVYLSAEKDSSKILTRAGADDMFEVERLAGDWVEVSFRKPVTGFVGPEKSASRNNGDKGAEVAAAAEKPEASQRPIVSDRSAIPTDGLLRTFEGHLGQPRTFFGRAPLHPFQIVDHSGSRIAYLDLSRLLITTPTEHFIGREFSFYGKAEPIEGRRDFVIRVERMMQK